MRKATAMRCCVACAPARSRRQAAQERLRWIHPSRLLTPAARRHLRAARRDELLAARGIVDRVLDRFAPPSSGRRS